MKFRAEVEWLFLPEPISVSVASIYWVLLFLLDKMLVDWGPLPLPLPLHTPPPPHPPFSILLASLDSSLALLLVDGGRQCESIVSCPVPPFTQEYQRVPHSLNEYCDFFFVLFWTGKNTILSLRDIYDYFCLVNKGRVRISLVFLHQALFLNSENCSLDIH